jgi:hypothetical protein
MRQFNIQALNVTDPDSNLEGSAILAVNLFAASVQVVTDGTDIEGTVVLQGSNDCRQDESQTTAFTPTNWADIADTSLSISANGVLISSKIDLCYEWIRVKFTSTEPTATGSVIVRLKVLGA